MFRKTGLTGHNHPALGHRVVERSTNMVCAGCSEELVPGFGPALQQGLLWGMEVLIGRPEENPPDRPEKTLRVVSLDNQTVSLQKRFQFTLGEYPHMVWWSPVVGRSDASLNRLCPFIRNA